MRATFAKIHVDNLYSNYKQIKAIVGGAKVIAVIKSNAYGHGIIEVARYLQEFGVDYLAVAFVNEGILLRESGINVPILVLVPENDTSIEASVDYNLDYAVESYELAYKLSEYSKLKGKKAKVHFYVDTGMGRDGMAHKQAKEIIKKCMALPNLDIVGLMSHFASSESDKKYTYYQLTIFKNLVEELKAEGIEFEIVHIANSGALINCPESFFNAVRPGIALYGYLRNGNGFDTRFKPVMELYSKVISIRKIQAGESVGYGRNFIASKVTNIATIPIGYGDGLKRILSDTLFCLIRGKKYKVVGGICMDEIMVDVGTDEIKMGDEVVLIGAQGDEYISGLELAEKSKTIIYEILTSISTRVPRIFVKNGNQNGSN